MITSLIQILAGNEIKASEVNNNFETLKQAHNELDAKVIRKNFLINGCGRVQQRGAYTLVKDVYGFGRADRWAGMATGTAISVGTLTYSSISGYGAAFGGPSGVTITGAGVLWLRQRIEAKNALFLKDKNVSFGCKIKHDVSTAINYTVYIRKANAVDNFSTVTEISNLGAQSIAGGAILDLKFENIPLVDCSNGLEVEIKIDCGAITNKSFWFEELQLELGAKVTAFEIRQFQEELALCRRYFEKSYNIDISPGTSDNKGLMHTYHFKDNGAAGYCTIPFKEEKRTVPTLILYSEGGSGGVWDYGWSGGTGTIGTNTTIYIGKNNAALQFNWGFSGTAFVTTFWAHGHWTASAEL